MFIKCNTDISINYSIIIDPINIDAVILIFDYQIKLNFRLLSVKFKITYNILEDKINLIDLFEPSLPENALPHFVKKSVILIPG